MLSYTIDGYSIYHYSQDNTYGQSAVINLHIGNLAVASLYFYRDGSPIPASGTSPDGKIIYARFHESRFAEIVETLRNEKPISVYFNPTNKWAWVMVGTGLNPEPVGEEEGR